MLLIQPGPLQALGYVGIKPLLSRPAEEKPRRCYVALDGGRLQPASLQLLPKGYYILPLWVSDALKRKVIKELSERLCIGLYRFRLCVQVGDEAGIQVRRYPPVGAQLAALDYR